MCLFIVAILYVALVEQCIKLLMRLRLLLRRSEYTIILVGDFRVSKGSSHFRVISYWWRIMKALQPWQKRPSKWMFRNNFMERIWIPLTLRLQTFPNLWNCNHQWIINNRNSLPLYFTYFIVYEVVTRYALWIDRSICIQVNSIILHN